ncbi:MAG TPA: hypothetical protein VNL17_03570 [Verrucomicrobiae bacterium]|nr:hypothetical protein [Verrucomicrobiae bacterium]
MALFGGMFGGGGQKHPNLDQLALAIHNTLNLQLTPPGDDVLAVTEALTHLDLIGFQNAHNLEGMQELLRAKSLRATIDSSAQTLTLSVASPEEIDRELKAEHGAVKVLHVGGHHASVRIIKPLTPAAEPVKAAAGPAASTAPLQPEAAAVPPAFEHLEAVERLCPVIVDTFVKHGQLTTADKEVLKKIKPIDYTLEGRMVALERWKTELSRRSRGIHVQQTGSTSLLASSADSSHQSEEALLRRFDTLLHWLSKLIKALEHKGFKFQGKPVWLPH